MVRDWHSDRAQVSDIKCWVYDYERCLNRSPRWGLRFSLEFWTSCVASRAPNKVSLMILSSRLSRVQYLVDLSQVL